MSRIGKLPIPVPSAVKVSIDGTTVSVEGPKGKINKTFDEAVSITLEDNNVIVKPANDTRFANAMYGTARSIIANMVQGVQNLFSKDLIIEGVGFKAEMRGKDLGLNLGFSHPINHPIHPGLTVDITDNGTKLKVSGVDKQLVGELAGAIKKYYPVEPYKGKGVRIVGEHVIRKEGKKTA